MALFSYIFRPNAVVTAILITMIIRKNQIWSIFLLTCPKGQMEQSNSLYRLIATEKGK